MGHVPQEKVRGELDRVKWLGRMAAGHFPQLVRGIGDDAAILRPGPGEDLVATTDLFVEGIHFRREWAPARQAGERCLSRGLSDIAAMGARPLAAFVSAAIPRDLAGKWTTDFFSGLVAAAGKHAVPLAGGDLSGHPETFTADIVLLGAVAAGQALLRSGARPGDRICITGLLGAAAAELERQQSGKQKKQKHIPQPRLAVGRALRKLGATACMDLSDGLSLDLTRLCEASEVAAEVHAEAIPAAPQATFAQVLHGGEDYELLFTLPAKRKPPRRIAGVPVAEIGTVRSQKKNSPRVFLVQNGTSSPLESRGWQHFTS